MLGPARCSGLCQGTTQEYNACVARNETQSCATSKLGSTHCFVATGEYTDLSDQSKGSGAVSGCIDCAGKNKIDRKMTTKTMFSYQTYVIHALQLYRESLDLDISYSDVLTIC